MFQLQRNHVLLGYKPPLDLPLGSTADILNVFINFLFIAECHLLIRLLRQKHHQHQIPPDPSLHHREWLLSFGGIRSQCDYSILLPSSDTSNQG